jgi:ribosome biogenesis protein MAK21
MAPKASSDLKGKQKALRIEETPEWYTLVPALAAPAKPPKAPTAAQLSDAQTRAGTLHAELLAAHSDLTNDASADGAFLQKVLKGGTLSDRLSALTLLAQASPLHAPMCCRLVGWRRRARAQAQVSSSCVQFLRSISLCAWPRYFREQPVTHPDVTDRHLVIWYFEDWLKKYFFSILQILEVRHSSAFHRPEVQADEVV